MLKFIKTISIYLVLITALSTIGFYTYKYIKTSLILYNTLHSEHWKNLVEEFKKTPAKCNSVIFLGDSHTEQFDFEHFGLPEIVNRGITGDFTEGILLRLDEIIRSHPKKIFIEIGTNDIIEKVSEKDICKNYERIIYQITKEIPKTGIYIQSIFPVSMEGTFLTSNKDINNRIIHVNEKLKVLAEEHHLVYINLYDKFSENNSLRNDLNSDGIHLNNKGYAIWAETIKPFLY